MEKICKGVLEGDKLSLAKAITLVESSKDEDRALVQRLMASLPPLPENLWTLAVTGSPGVGKSTFIESFGLDLVDRGKKTAVLTIDPSSVHSGGSILGDKTRMPKLSGLPDAYIRPSPSSGQLGGVRHSTRNSIILCQAAGFDPVIIETVGVGQSEIEIQSLVDFVILLILPNAGDELQGMKKGIMELADLIFVNKADGSNIKSANKTKAQLMHAVHLATKKIASWEVPIILGSALEKSGFAELWEQISEFFNFLDREDRRNRLRQRQIRTGLEDEIRYQWMRLLEDGDMYEHDKKKLILAVLDGKMTLAQAADTYIAKCIQSRSQSTEI